MTNIIKFQSPFERLKDNNQNSEIALIKAIILQAIIDATNISSCREARKNEIEAKAWLYGGSEDFQLMCEYINYNVNYIRKVAREVEKLHKNSSMKIKNKNNILKTRMQSEILLNEKLYKKVYRAIN